MIFSNIDNNAQNIQNNRTKLFNQGWSFKKDSTLIESEIYTINDSGWKKIDLPHDWSIEDLPNQTTDSIIGPFSKNSIGKVATGWTVGGTGWYIKKFNSEKEWDSKYISILFDGVYMIADVYINGTLLGSHPHGYAPFHYNLSPYLKPSGKENVLAVRVQNESKNSRWYAGSGIYRDVWLTVTNPIHVDTWGVYITTPQVSAKEATIEVNTTIRNEQLSQDKIKYITRIISRKGKIVSQKTGDIVLSGDTIQTLSLKMNVSMPELWAPETPTLYTAVTEIEQGSKVIDKVETIFGIRTIRVSAESGLMLNGHKILLKGGCIHHDNGALGAKAFARAEERKVQLLKENGFNAIRSSHNPPSKYLLEACDKYGMLVIDEAFDVWGKSKNPDDYHLYFEESWNKDLTSILLRDRNHPSIIFWSIGNEIPDRVRSSGLETRVKLRQRVTELDSTRFITEAICRTPQWERKTPAAFKELDVAGYNYVWNNYKPDHYCPKKFSHT
jgi:beta-galactosidase